jgi:tetratricopeptide (TPR) repeat protein
LIDPSRNAALWDHSYDCTFSDVIAAQNTIAREIARALGMHITQPDERALTAIATSNPRAFEAYLKGRYLWLQRKLDSYQQAKEYFEQAIALDQNYAQAYAGLADAYQFLAASGGVYGRKENYDKAKSAYKRALEIDPMLAEAHASAGLIAMNYDWNWPLAEQELRRAIALDSNEALFYDWYAEYLMAVGRTAESVDNMERARELDPFSIIINCDLGKMYYYARLYQEAETQLKETLRMNPDFRQAHRYLGGVYVMKERFDDAIAEFKKAASNEEWEPGFTAYAYGMAGRKAEAERILERTKGFFARRGDFGKLPLAVAYIGSGQKDRAIECLEQEYRDHSVAMTSLKSNPEYDSLRSDPRFVDLLRRVHLAPK